MNRTIVITGASSGIGAALAIRLAKPEHRLVLVARRADRLAEVAATCRADGSEVHEVVGSVVGAATISSISTLANQSENQIVLVNNAGNATFGPTADQEQWIVDEMIDVHLRASIKLVQAVLPTMISAKTGQIFNISSIVVDIAFPESAVYTAVKSGLSGFSRALASEVRKHGIRVTDVRPGATDTEIWTETSPDRSQMIPAERIADIVASLIESPMDHAVDEIVITPPLGVL